MEYTTAAQRIVERLERSMHRGHSRLRRTEDEPRPMAKADAQKEEEGIFFGRTAVSVHVNVSE